MSYKCKHFALHELVSREIYESVPESQHWKIWIALDDRILRAIDILRDELGPITINNWFWGGNRNNSGLRDSSSPYYSKWSQHSWGRAVDMIFKNMDATTARSRIKKLIRQGKMKKAGLSFTFEEKMRGKEISWVHMDARSAPEGYNGFNV